MVKTSRPSRGTKFVLNAETKKKALTAEQQKQKPSTSQQEPAATADTDNANTAMTNSLGHETRKLSKKEQKKIAKSGKGQKPQQQKMPLAAPGAACSVRDLINASLTNNNTSVARASANNNNKKSNKRSSTNNNNNIYNNNNDDNSDPFMSFGASNDWQDGAQQQQNNTSLDSSSSSIYQSPEQLLTEGNKFFIKRNKEERALTLAAKKKIEEMKRINQKGGDGSGFKYIIPKSVKKLASRMAGDVDVTLDDKKDAINTKLLPVSGNSIVRDGEDVNETGGLNDDDRPMRKKQPRAKKELNDFYTWQKWKNWTKNAENFLQRGKLSRKVFDSKRKFKSV